MGRLERFIQPILTPLQVKLFFTTLLVALVAFFMGLVIPMPQSQITSLGSAYSGASQSLVVLNPVVIWFIVFLNNIRVAALMAIPILGFMAFPLSMLSTGQFLQAAVISGAINAQFNISPLFAGIALFLLPHTIIEFSAYSLAASSAVVFLMSIIKKPRAKKAALKTWAKTLMAAAFLVAVAAALEALTWVSAIVAGMLWFPLFYAVFKLRRWYKESLNSPI